MSDSHLPRMRLTMVSLMSELTSYGWKNGWLSDNIITSDPSLVVVAGIILFRPLFISVAYPLSS